MFKHHIAATSLAFALMSATAIAQTTAPAPNTAPASPGAPSVTGAPAGGTTVAPANMSWQGKWRSTELIGVDIYGPNSEKVGDVTEVIFDRTGRIEMVTVGVGGFLGIGQKDVAIPFDQVKWSDQPIASATAAPAGGTAAPAGGTAAPATGTVGGTAAGGTAAPATGTAAGGTAAPATGMAGTAGTAGTASRAPMMHPDHGRITLTKDQLNSAPAVNYSGT